ncbi:DUF1433 domain-containing protein [Roseburia sp. 1XD42-34]|nr:DUF1433 domain-containing protein [Roseburia sp. 1XD42-34]NBJ68739.1 DUF1433 domain-containing protein [Roseburia sp. 1XD42-34]RKI80589.1 DUF1433 domain-containing protein [Clostridium sp. 1xD42-85]
MKKLFISTIFIITIILLGGCIVNSNNEDFDDETIRKAEESVEKFLKNNYKDIRTVDFEKGDYSTPMGGMVISGIVNNNKEATFSIDIDYQSNFRVGSISEGNEFPEIKEECKERTCDY